MPGVDWETCMTLNTTWGYSEHDHKWKSPETLIRNLIDIASKGGNYLLNIGPKADGSVPQESVDSMKAIGAWMKVNGDAIYGTKASPFEKLDWGRCTRKAAPGEGPGSTSTYSTGRRTANSPYRWRRPRRDRAIAGNRKIAASDRWGSADDHRGGWSSAGQDSDSNRIEHPGSAEGGGRFGGPQEYRIAWSRMQCDPSCS